MAPKQKSTLGLSKSFRKVKTKILDKLSSKPRAPPSAMVQVDRIVEEESESELEGEVEAENEPERGSPARSDASIAGLAGTLSPSPSRKSSQSMYSQSSPQSETQHSPFAEIKAEDVDPPLTLRRRGGEHIPERCGLPVDSGVVADALQPSVESSSSSDYSSLATNPQGFNVDDLCPSQHLEDSFSVWGETGYDADNEEGSKLRHRTVHIVDGHPFVFSLSGSHFVESSPTGSSGSETSSQLDEQAPPDLVETPPNELSSSPEPQEELVEEPIPDHALLDSADAPKLAAPQDSANTLRTSTTDSGQDILVRLDEVENPPPKTNSPLLSEFPPNSTTSQDTIDSDPTAETFQSFRDTIPPVTSSASTSQVEQEDQSGVPEEGGAVIGSDLPSSDGASIPPDMPGNYTVDTTSRKTLQSQARDLISSVGKPFLDTTEFFLEGFLGIISSLAQASPSQTSTASVQAAEDEDEHLLEKYFMVTFITPPLIWLWVLCEYMLYRWAFSPLTV